MKDLRAIRQQHATYTQAIPMLVNLLTIESQGNVERLLGSQMAELQEMKKSLEWVAASVNATNRGGSQTTLTSLSSTTSLIRRIGPVSTCKSVESREICVW